MNVGSASSYRKILTSDFIELDFKEISYLVWNEKGFYKLIVTYLFRFQATKASYKMV